MKAGFLKKSPSRSVIRQAMYYGAFLLLISLGLGGTDIYVPPVWAVQDRASSQKEPQVELKLPQVIEVLPYSKDGIHQKLFILWSVEVPFSAETINVFARKSSDAPNRAFVLTESDPDQFSRQKVHWVHYYFVKTWPFERWFGNLVWDEETKELVILTYRTRIYTLQMSLFRISPGTIQPLGAFPLSFDPKKIKDWPKSIEPLYVGGKELYGSFGSGFRSVKSVPGATNLWICLERDRPGENPAFLRFDLRSKELTEVTFQNKPDKPDPSKSEK